MKIGIFTDLHANLPALEVSLKRFKEMRCDLIIHVGDLIGIGPYPKECLELATSVKEMKFVMGNHDYWYAFGLPEPIPTYMNEEEVAHQQWTHDQIGDSFKAVVKEWKFNMDMSVDNHYLNCRHYGLNLQRTWFKKIIKSPSADQLNQLFEDVPADMVFYGHNHNSSDIAGNSRYINLGSAGCYNQAISRIGILHIEGDQYKLHKESLEYNDQQLLKEFDLRDVPARNFIRKVFLKR